jgi:hypothetical protein
MRLRSGGPVRNRRQYGHCGSCDSGRNIVFISGAETMKSYLNGYYQVLFDAAPTIYRRCDTDDAFYYGS